MFADPNDAYHGSWVADISLALANGSLINKYRAFGGLFRRIHAARTTAQKFNTGSKLADPKQKALALKKLEKLEKNLKQINVKYSKTFSNQVVGAYVTFNNEESVSRCLEDYKSSYNTCNSCCCAQAEPLRLGGRHLKVRRAPDPSQIVWENLELSKTNRWCRQGFIAVALVALLAVSFLFIMLAQAYQTRFRASVPNLGLCSTLLPALAFGQNVTANGNLAINATLPPGLSLVRDTSNAVCNAEGYSRLYWSTSAAGYTSASSVNSTSPCLNECYAATNSPGTCSVFTSEGPMLSFARKDVVACYCTQQIRSLISSKGLFTGLRALISNDGSYCFNTATDYISYNVLIIIASGVVVFINTVLSALLKSITWLEGHPDLDSVHSSVAFKVFLALFLNTGTLLTHANCRNVCVYALSSSCSCACSLFGADHQRRITWSGIAHLRRRHETVHWTIRLLRCSLAYHCGSLHRADHDSELCHCTLVPSVPHPVPAPMP
jgi:hypothetical protein